MNHLLQSIAFFVKGMIREVWPIFFGFFFGGLLTALTFRLDLCEVIPQILSDAMIIFVIGVLDALAWCLGKVVRWLYRNRGFVPVNFSANHEGRTVYRAVLWIPWEWKKLSLTDQAQLIVAQLKGQEVLNNKA